MIRTKQERAAIEVAKVLANLERLEAKKLKRESMAAVPSDHRAKRLKRSERTNR